MVDANCPNGIGVAGKKGQRVGQFKGDKQMKSKERNVVIVTDSSKKCIEVILGVVTLLLIWDRQDYAPSCVPLSPPEIKRLIAALEEAL